MKKWYEISHISQNVATFNNFQILICFLNLLKIVDRLSFRKIDNFLHLHFLINLSKFSKSWKFQKFVANCKCLEILESRQFLPSIQIPKCQNVCKIVNSWCFRKTANSPNFWKIDRFCHFFKKVKIWEKNPFVHCGALIFFSYLNEEYLEKIEKLFTSSVFNYFLGLRRKKNYKIKNNLRLKFSNYSLKYFFIALNF